MDIQDWKDKLGAAFGIEASDEASKTSEATQPAAAAPVQAQGSDVVNVVLDRKGRKGKQATIVEGLHIADDDLKELARQLKQACGVGGSTRGGEILIQGDKREQVLAALKERGYKARII